MRKNKALTVPFVLWAMIFIVVPLVMIVKFEGTADAVKSALEAGVAEAKKRDLFIVAKVNAGFSEEAEWFSHLSALGKDKLRAPKTQNS